MTVGLEIDLRSSMFITSRSVPYSLCPNLFFALSMIPKIKVIKEDLNEAGQPIPRVAIHFSSNIALEAIAKLQELDPIVEVVHNSRNTIWLSADGLQKGEEVIVTTQVKKALAKLNL